MKVEVALLLCCVTTLWVVNVLHVSANDNSWTDRASMPTSRAGLGVAAVNGRIYAIGGWNPCPINTTEEYNPATDTWSTKSAMPTARMFFGTAVYQDRIYVKGGKVGQKATNVTEVYDPSTDKWTIGTPIPNAVYGYASAVVGRKIYVISGSTLSPNSSITSLNQVYDVDSDSWTLGARVPTAVNAPAGISITDGHQKYLSSVEAEANFMLLII